MNVPLFQVDERLSFAHRVGDEVAVRVRVPGDALGGGAVEVRLRAGRHRHLVTAVVDRDGDGAALTFRVPQSELRSRVWHLAIRPPAEDHFVRVEARLLARPGQPVALLPGPTPETRHPAPRPRKPQPAHQRLARRLPVPVRDRLRRGRTALRSALDR